MKDHLYKPNEMSMQTDVQEVRVVVCEVNAMMDGDDLFVCGIIPKTSMWSLSRRWKFQYQFTS